MRDAVRRVVTVVILLLSAPHPPAGAADVVVDCAKPAGEFRPLHGVNGGPLDRGGLIDLSAQYRQLQVPLVRLHDCHWPNPDVVDVHVVFPNPGADPSRPESYDFLRTDEYLRAIVAAGGRIVYRLGESIEHGPDKRRQRPPADPEKWAAVCLGIIRHYNEGWANGFRYDVRYWEVWNEPDNRPNCWTGSDEEYFRLYATAAKAIKRQFPHLRVGGPAVGNVGRVEKGGANAAPVLRPSPFVEKFLAFCKRESAPLDFFSWHLYGDDPAAVAAHAKAVRKLLDAGGFGKVESHLNEWNYLPDNDWRPVMLAGQGESRRKFYDRLGGAEGAAFAASVLLLLQDCPLDAANYFTGDAGDFGLFDPYGVPRKTFHAFRAFRMLLDTPVRLAASWEGGGPPAVVAAGTNRQRDAVTVVLIRPRAEDAAVELSVRSRPWAGPTRYELLLLDAEHDLAPARTGLLAEGEALRFNARAPAVLVVKLRRADPSPARRSN